jgi:hypothetical protein
MITKKEKLQTLIREGKIDQAIKVASNFTRDFTQEEHRDIQIAAECIGNPGRQQFYAQMAYNLTEIRKDVEKSLENWYLKSTKS